MTVEAANTTEQTGTHREIRLGERRPSDEGVSNTVHRKPKAQAADGSTIRSQPDRDARIE